MVETATTYWIIERRKDNILSLPLSYQKYFLLSLFRSNYSIDQHTLLPVFEFTYLSCFDCVFCTVYYYQYDYLTET